VRRGDPPAALKTAFFGGRMLRLSSRLDHLRTPRLPLLLAAACAAAGFAQTASPAPSIRQTDFRNFTYRPACLGLGGKAPPIRVKDGEYARDKGVEDRVYFKVVDVVFGDLDGDGQEEAVVETVCNTGGTGNFSDGIIFKLRNGRPAPVATLGMGDRADGGIDKIRVENGLIKVGRYGGRSGACCPDYVETYTHKLAGGKLVDVGRPVRGDYVDDEGYRAVRRVRFERGASSAKLTGTTKGASEYVLGARAEDVLTRAFGRADLDGQFERRRLHARIARRRGRRVAAARRGPAVLGQAAEERRLPRRRQRGG
jgi:hypothetical protein